MKTKGNKGLVASPTQGENVFQKAIVRQEVHITIEENAGLISTTNVYPLQWLLVIL